MTPACAILHPWLDIRGAGRPPDVAPAHTAWSPPDPDPLDTGRLRYIPPPSLLLLHTLRAWMLAHGERLEAIAPERRALLLDAHGAFDGIREEYSRPLRAAPPDDVTPLLFPHTSDMSAASMAAILFAVQGPVICLHPLGGTAPDLVQEAFALLDDGLCDGVMVAAVHHLPMPLKADAARLAFDASGIPSADCGVALLVLRDSVCARRADCDTVRRRAGFTGVCESLLEYVWP